jgi:hypothetical protein
VTEQPTTGAQPLSASAGAPAGPPQPSGATAELSARIEERPELAVGGAFAGGLILAFVFKRLAR